MTLQLDGYVRVSSVRGREGESFISPDVQRQQIESWCNMRGALIVAWHTDLDQSGARDDRPGLLEAMRRIEAGQTGGLVVAKLDRFARSLTGALEAIQRIDRAGGIVVSVAEGVDPSTPAGKMLMRIMLVFAEWELDRIRETWLTARERAVARGIHIASRTPTGYVKGDDGRLVPHPQFAAAVAQMFVMRASGASWGELADYLEAQGVIGPYGSPHWTSRALSHVIANRAYLGEARSGQFVNHQAHPPIVEREVWEAAQVSRGVSSPRGNPALLTGLVRCAGCRYVMKPDSTRRTTGALKGQRVRTYRCRGRRSAGTCEKRGAVLGSVIETWVEQQFLDRVGRLVMAPQVDDSDLVAAQAEVDAAEAELAAYRDERIAGVLGADRYLEGLRSRMDAFEAASVELAEQRARLAPSELPLAEIQETWPSLDVSEKRRILTGAIDCVFLRSIGQGTVPIGDRALIFWRGEAPNDLPGPGRRLGAIEPFDWPPT